MVLKPIFTIVIILMVSKISFEKELKADFSSRDALKTMLIKGGSDAIRKISEGLKSKLQELKNEVLQYPDQSATAPFSQDIFALQKAMVDLQKIILKAPKEEILTKILDINQKHLGLVERWEKFKAAAAATATVSPVSALKQKITDLNDQLISLQFELIRYPATTTAKEPYSRNLKDLQSLISTLLNNLSNLDPTKAEQKANLIEQAIGQLKNEWNVFKANSATATTTAPTSTTPDPSRLELQKTIKQLLSRLSDLKKQIASSSIEANSKNAQILAITGNEKILGLLDSVVKDSDVGSIVNTILGVKDAVQEIVQQWNEAVVNAQTSTTSKPTVPSLNPDEIRQELVGLRKLLGEIRESIRLLPLDNLQTKNLLNDNNALLQKIASFETKFPSLANNEVLQMLQLIKNNVNDHQNKVNSALMSATSTQSTIPPDQVNTLNDHIDKLEVALLETKIALLNVPGDKSFTKEFEDRVDSLQAKLDSIRNNLAVKNPADTESQLDAVQVELDQIREELNAILELITGTTTSGSVDSSTSTVLETTTVSSSVASALANILDSLDSTLQSINSQLEAFPGDQSTIQGFSDQHDALSSLVSQLKDDLPATSLSQVNDAVLSVQALKESYKSFIDAFEDLFSTTETTSTESATATSLFLLQAQLSDMKNKISAFPGDSSLVSDFLNRNDQLLELVDQLIQGNPSPTQVSATESLFQNLIDDYEKLLSDFEATSATQASLTTLSSNDVIQAFVALENLIKDATALKQEISDFPGDKALTIDLFLQASNLLSDVTNLKQKLPYTSLDEVARAENTLTDLRKRFDDVVNFIGNSATTTLSPIKQFLASKALEGLLAQLLDMKNKVLDFADQSLVADFSKQNDDLTDLVTQLKQNLPSTTMDEIGEADSDVQALVSDFDNFLSGSTTVSPQTTTLSMVDTLLATITLDSLQSTLNNLKDKILAVPDQAKVADFLKKDDLLSNIVNQLKQGLPATSKDQISSVESGIQTLVSDFDKFVAASSLTTTAQPPTTTQSQTTGQQQITTLSPTDYSSALFDLNSLSAQLLGLKDKILSYPEQSLVAGFLRRNDYQASYVDQLKKQLPFTTKDQISSALTLFNILKNEFEQFILNSTFITTTGITATPQSTTTTTSTTPATTSTTLATTSKTLTTTSTTPATTTSTTPATTSTAITTPATTSTTPTTTTSTTTKLTTTTIATTTVDPDVVLFYPGFSELGSFTGETAQNVSYTKKFMFPTHYIGTWTDALNICKSFKMNLLSLDSQEEALHFLGIYVGNYRLFTEWTHIGGVTTVVKSPTEWYWVNTRKKVNFPLKFIAGAPDNYGGFQRCLVLNTVNENYGFNDIQCFDVEVMKFMCQLIA